MSLLFVVGLWIVFGSFVYRAHKRARSLPMDRSQGQASVALDHRRDPDDIPEADIPDADVPDTVPHDWVEAYRTENGG